MNDNSLEAVVRRMQAEALALKTAYVKSASVLSVAQKPFSLDFYISTNAEVYNTAVVTLTTTDGRTALTDVAWDGTSYLSDAGATIETTRVAADGAGESSYLVTCQDFKQEDWGTTVTVPMTATATSDFSINIEYHWGQYEPQF